MRVIPAEGFQVSAHPERYGSTGRKSFYIDESGILRGGDVSAERNFQNWTTLPRVRDNPVYDDYDNVIAESLITLSRRLAGEGEFERAKQILSEVRTEYYMMPAAAGVSDAMESLTRHMYEDGARQAYAAAEKLAEDGRLRESLTRLKSIKTNYEQSLIIPQVRAKILQVEDKISSILEAEAKAIFEKAQEYEKQGEYDKAVIEYKKIVKELDSTSYYDRAAALITTVESIKQEKEAEDLFSKIAELNLEESYSEAITAVDTLINHYAGTDFVKKNQSRLNAIRSTAIGEREKLNTINAFQAGNFDAAIQAGESAVSANPALRATIVPILSYSYLKRAEALFVNGAYARAVGYYENWMNISEYRGTPEHKNYIESLYNVSKAFFDEGKYLQAKEGLEGMERYFSGRDDFWYMLGSISAYEKDYARAISRFRRSVSINEDNPHAWYKKALCKMVFIQEEEEKLKQHIDQLFKLKRGADLFYEISTLVNALNAKDLEIKHLAAATGGGEAGERRRARLTAERDAFASETRAKMISLNETLRQNKNIRDRLLQTANAISDAYNETNSHILKIPSGRMNRIRSDFIGSFRRKRQAFESFRKLERGLNQEMRLEENAILNLEFSLGKFTQERAFDSELRDMFRLREGIAQMGMRQSVEEGREELLKALEIKLPAEEHIASIL